MRIANCHISIVNFMINAFVKLQQLTGDEKGNKKDHIDVFVLCGCLNHKLYLLNCMFV